MRPPFEVGKIHGNSAAKTAKSKGLAVDFTSNGPWKGLLLYKTTVYKTTWKFRFLAVAAMAILLFTTRAWWLPAVGRSLVCNSDYATPDVIVIDNLDSDYLLFEKAAELREHGIAAKVIVPVQASGRNPQKPNLVSQEIVNVMVRVAGLDGVESIPIKHDEPITLNAARQVGDHLRATNPKTVLLLTSGFKSKRLHLIFQKALGKAGITVYCLPVWGGHRPENWATTWHGVQEVLLQLVKLGYYWAFVL